MPLSDKGLFSSAPDRPESVPEGVVTLWDALIESGKAMFGDDWQNHDLFAHRTTGRSGQVSTVQLENSVGSWARGQQAWDQLRQWLEAGNVQAFRHPKTPIKPETWEENRSRFILRSGKIRRPGKRPWDWVVVSKSDLDQMILDAGGRPQPADN